MRVSLDEHIRSHHLQREQAILESQSSSYIPHMQLPVVQAASGLLDASSKDVAMLSAIFIATPDSSAPVCCQPTFQIKCLQSHLDRSASSAAAISNTVFVYRASSRILLPPRGFYRIALPFCFFLLTLSRCCFMFSFMAILIHRQIFVGYGWSSCYESSQKSSVQLQNHARMCQSVGYVCVDSLLLVCHMHDNSRVTG